MSMTSELTTVSALTRTQKLVGAFVGASAIAAAMLLTTLADHAQQPSTARPVVLAQVDDPDPTLKPFPTDELPDPTLKPFPTQPTTPPPPQRGGIDHVRVPGGAKGVSVVG
jgi:hypothetical protein